MQVCAAALVRDAPRVMKNTVLTMACVFMKSIPAVVYLPVRTVD